MSNQSGEVRREAARLEAFSDGVMAVIITIMAFGLNVPRDTTWHAAAQQLPSLLVYLLSFTLIGSTGTTITIFSGSRTASAARSCGLTFICCSGCR
jgi:hypothetical protein